MELTENSSTADQMKFCSRNIFPDDCSEDVEDKGQADLIEKLNALRESCEKSTKPSNSPYQTPKGHISLSEKLKHDSVIPSKAKRSLINSTDNTPKGDGNLDFIKGIDYMEEDEKGVFAAVESKMKDNQLREKDISTSALPQIVPAINDNANLESHIIFSMEEKDTGYHSEMMEQNLMYSNTRPNFLKLGSSLKELEDVLEPTNIKTSMFEEGCSNEVYKEFMGDSPQPMDRQETGKDIKSGNTDFSFMAAEQEDHPTKIHYFEEDLRPNHSAQVSSTECNDISEFLSSFSFGSEEDTESEPQQVITKPIRAQILAPEFPYEFRRILQCQLAQHVQLLASVTVLCNHRVYYSSVSNGCRRMLNELQNASSHEDSMYHPQNLKLAFDMLFVHDKNKTTNDSGMLTTFPDDVKEVFLQSSALPYGKLLPKIIFNKEFQTKERSFLPSEDLLLALRLQDVFSEESNRKLALNKSEIFYDAIVDEVCKVPNVHYQKRQIGEYLLRLWKSEVSSNPVSILYNNLSRGDLAVDVPPLIVEETLPGMPRKLRNVSSEQLDLPWRDFVTDFWRKQPIANEDVDVNSKCQRSSKNGLNLHELQSASPEAVIDLSDSEPNNNRQNNSTMEETVPSDHSLQNAASNTQIGLNVSTASSIVSDFASSDATKHSQSSTVLSYSAFTPTKLLCDSLAADGSIVTSRSSTLTTLETPVCSNTISEPVTPEMIDLSLNEFVSNSISSLFSSNSLMTHILNQPLTPPPPVQNSNTCLSSPVTPIVKKGPEYLDYFTPTKSFYSTPNKKTNNLSQKLSNETEIIDLISDSPPRGDGVMVVEGEVSSLMKRNAATHQLFNTEEKNDKRPSHKSVFVKSLKQLCNDDMQYISSLRECEESSENYPQIELGENKSCEIVLSAISIPSDCGSLSQIVAESSTFNATEGVNDRTILSKGSETSYNRAPNGPRVAFILPAPPSKNDSKIPGANLPYRSQMRFRAIRRSPKISPVKKVSPILKRYKKYSPKKPTRTKLPYILPKVQPKLVKKRVLRPKAPVEVNPSNKKATGPLPKPPIVLNSLLSKSRKGAANKSIKRNGKQGSTNTFGKEEDESYALVDEEEEGDDDDDIDEQVREDHLAALLKASSTIDSRRGDRKNGPKMHKMNKQQKKLQARIDSLSRAPDEEVQRKALCLNYLIRVRESLIPQQKAKFQQFVNLLLKFEESPYSPENLYFEVAELLKDFPILCDEFVSFLKPEQAIRVGKYVEYCSIICVKDFIDKLQHQFGRHSQQVAKVIRMLHTLQKRPSFDLDELKNIMGPILRYPHLLESLSQCFPSESPIPSLSDDFEEASLGDDDPGSPDSAEFVILPDDDDDRMPPDQCTCECHSKEGSTSTIYGGLHSNNQGKSDHCLSCGIRFIDGRVYLQCGKILRPAKITYIDLEDRDPIVSTSAAASKQKTSRKGNIKDVGSNQSNSKSKNNKSNSQSSIGQRNTESDKEKGAPKIHIDHSKEEKVISNMKDKKGRKTSKDDKELRTSKPQSKGAAHKRKFDQMESSSSQRDKKEKTKKNEKDSVPSNKSSKRSKVDVKNRFVSKAHGSGKISGNKAKGRHKNTKPNPVANRQSSSVPSDIFPMGMTKCSDTSNEVDPAWTKDDDLIFVQMFKEKPPMEVMKNLVAAFPRRTKEQVQERLRTIATCIINKFS